jgi:hypothetical protein
MKRNLLSVLILTLLVAGCSNDSDPVADKGSFTKIYDNSKFSASYYPIDMKQTADGGYLILAGRRMDDSNFSGVYVMKTDELGAFVTDHEAEDDLVNPIGMLQSNDKYYFFVMNPISLQGQLVEMAADGTMNAPIPVGGSYPSAVAQDGANFLLLNYDSFNKESVVSIVTPAGQVSKSKGFSIGAGDAVEEPIINHFLRTGKQLPFQVGKNTSGQYFFNGFYNYTLSLVFTDLNADDPQGVVQGQHDDGGLSQVVPLSGGKYAASRFNYGDNYFLPNTSLNSSGTTSSVDLGGNTLPELTPNAPVKIIKATISGKEYLLYASNTRSRQIALFAYDLATGEFKGSHYLGFSNPFELSSLITTTDGGLAVCGTTYVAGRFPRICLFKLSSEQLTKAF